MQEIELKSPAAKAPAGPSAPVSSAYEAVPYESFPFPRTHIRHLHAMGRLFGLAAADPGRCRVLELGGAAGGNLLPMAIDHPGSSFIGVDLAAGQIERGRRQIAELGLANIELRAMSLVDVEASFGSFDYVIAHGVYSWVSAEVRARLFAVCRERLASGGILLVSYNTLPGWSVWQSLRDIILFHGRRFPDPRERARQARRLLQSLRETGHGDKSPYWEMLRYEIEKTEDLSDWFFLHEHVEEENTPFYFHDVVDRARRAELDHVGEADLTAMNLAALPAPAMQAFGGSGDLISRLQYLDVVQNRRFRMSLFCRRGEGPGRLPQAEDLWDFRWSTILRAQPLAGSDPAPPGATSFVGPAGELRLRTPDPLGSAVYDTLCRQVLPQRPDELVQQAARRFGIADEEGLRAALLQPALGLVMSNLITLHSHPPRWVAEISDRPQASRLARAQARQGDWVTSQRHEPVGADPLLREMIRLADGRHSRVAMVEALRRQVERGKLSLQPEGRPALDRAGIARMVPGLVDQLLGFMAASALLVA